MGLGEVAAGRLGLALLPALTAATIGCYAALSPAVAAPVGGGPWRPPRVSSATRRTLWRVGSLFALDGLGGGLLVTSLISYFFFERFGRTAAEVALLFFAARLANIGSHFGAAWLAGRIGLVPTMVFTHLPSSLLLLAVPLAPSFAWAAALFLAREGLVEMDVPTRQSYVMAMVGPEERAAAAGVTNLVRVAAWAVGTLLAGVLMQRLGLAAPLAAGAGIKIVYDVLLWLACRGRRPPEEAGS
jgi:predicted MFS family arabinose efflux permease